ncbi:MAG: MBL fold metallo-hydrolase [Clostridia bacterium]|nr:MBL fold metallo-hydrolase [Clostridia bacterium]
MIVRTLGQSGYIIRSGKSEIVLDPYLSDSVNRVAKRPRALPMPVEASELSPDAVICSHDHLDHLDPDTVTLMRDSQLFITTSEGKEKLLSLGKKNVKALSVGEKISVGDIEITAVFADHTVEAFGVIIRAENLTLYFSGDTLYNEKLFDISAYKPDATFICINGRLGNMNVDEALITAKKIGAPINIPNHYDMFESNSEDPHLFADKIDGGFIMEFNTSYELSKRNGTPVVKKIN